MLATLILCSGLARASVQNINGELTPSDFLATDSTSKTFYYDLYELSNPTASSVTVTLTIDAGALLRPWAAYWSTPLLPTPDWESPTDIYSAADNTQSSATPGDTISFASFSLPAGATYQLAVATQNYNQDGAQLDTYLLSVDGTGVEIEAIPEPSSLPLPSTSIIALEGDAVPEGGGTFLSFNSPVVNDAGQMAFRAFLAGTPGGTFDDRAIYRGTSSATLAKIVRTNDPFGGDLIGEVNARPVINQLGEIAIYAEAAAAGDILLRSSADGLSLTEIARRGDTTPTGDGEFGFFDTVAINNSGAVGFYASIDNAANPDEFEALYKSDGTTTTKIVRSAQEATVVGDTLIIESLAFNDAGQVSFYADTFGGDVVLYLGDGTSLAELYRNGDPVPDAGGGTFNFPTFPTMNESGDIAIGTVIDGAPGSDSGVYRTVNGSFEKIWRKGDPAPGGSAIFNTYSGLPIINDSGEVAFLAFLNNTPNGIDDNGGIFATDGTAIVRIAQERDVVPEGTGRFWLFDDLSFNNHGQAAFQARLRLTSNGNSNDEGLYFYDPVEGLIKIAREGDTLLGSTISSSLATRPLTRPPSTPRGPA
ncbi:choice-of-anchor tandem repeat NxxGxxAF-containing protein [Haloferula sp. A504]|uniref:DUF7453 family protein n=1 Tax=Haloferula sp. A504 TaxID=3373601 RepID=UPI0031CA4EFB|nr:hypothetical protein [Verrucomicrobiaceae bacterium E54]